GSFSTTTVFKPSSPARMAATYPPGPLPIIATSYLATRYLPSRSPRHLRQIAKRWEEVPPGPPRVLQTEKKPSAPQARTAATQQTQNFNSGPARPPLDGIAEEQLGWVGTGRSGRKLISGLDERLVTWYICTYEPW